MLQESRRAATMDAVAERMLGGTWQGSHHLDIHELVEHLVSELADLGLGVAAVNWDVVVLPKRSTNGRRG